MTTSRLRRWLLAGGLAVGVLGVGVTVPTMLRDRAHPAPPPPDLRTLVTCTDVEVITVGHATADGRTPDEAIDQLMGYVGHPDLITTARRQTVYSTPTARTITVTPDYVDARPVAAFAFDTGPSGRLTLSSWAKCWGFQP